MIHSEMTKKKLLEVKKALNTDAMVISIKLSFLFKAASSSNVIVLILL